MPGGLSVDSAHTAATNTSGDINTGNGVEMEDDTNKTTTSNNNNRTSDYGKYW